MTRCPGRARRGSDKQGVRSHGPGLNDSIGEGGESSHFFLEQEGYWGGSGEGEADWGGDGRPVRVKVAWIEGRKERVGGKEVGKRDSMGRPLPNPPVLWGIGIP